MAIQYSEHKNLMINASLQSLSLAEGTGQPNIYPVDILSGAPVPW
jgi:hypothetical protein